MERASICVPSINLPWTGAAARLPIPKPALAPLSNDVAFSFRASDALPPTATACAAAAATAYTHASWGMVVQSGTILNATLMPSKPPGSKERSGKSGHAAAPTNPPAAAAITEQRTARAVVSESESLPGTSDANASPPIARTDW